MSGAAAPLATPLIAQVVHRLDVGGLENGVVNLVNRMPADRYRHAIVCLAGFSETFRQRIQRADVEVISLDKRPGKDLDVYRRMYRVLRSLRPSIVHTRNLGTIDMQWVALAAGVRARVHGEHGWEASDPQGLDPGRLRIRRFCRPVIQRYVPMSRDIARWLVATVGVPEGKIRQLYNGVDVERFSPSPSPSPSPLAALSAARTSPASGRGGSSPLPSAGEVGQRPGEGSFPTPLPSAGEVGQRPGEGFFTSDTLTLGTLGRLDPVKNQESLLRAFQAISASRPDLGPRLRLVIAGDGPLRAKLEGLSNELGMADRCWFAGTRSDTPDVLRCLDVFVLPSVNEGISNTILEAMATGLPVVAGKVGGNPELVVDGVTGALYDTGRPGALDAAILAYLTDPDARRRHGEAGRARVVQNFSLDSMVQRYLDLYDEVLTPSSAVSGTGQG